MLGVCVCVWGGGGGGGGGKRSLETEKRHSVLVTVLWKRGSIP